MAEQAMAEQARPAGMAHVEKVVLGSDHAALRLKADLEALLTCWRIPHEDLGTHDESSCDYPDYAHSVARAVVAGEASCGILLCGTGIGMSIAANRHRGVRAAVCQEPLGARMARAHNDANVLCMGERLIGGGMAAEILEVFLTTAFEGGRHQRRIDKLEP